MRFKKLFSCCLIVISALGASGASADQNKIDIVVQAHVTESAFTCDTRGYLHVPPFKLLGSIPLALVPGSFASSQSLGSQEACWRKAILLNEKFDGQTISIPGVAAISYDSEWVDYGNKGYYLDIYESEFVLNFEGLSFVGRSLCKSRKYKNSCGMRHS